MKKPKVYVFIFTLVCLFQQEMLQNCDYQALRVFF